MRASKTTALLSVLSFTLIIMGQLMAASTGKIRGRVYEQETGNPLGGANVILQGTQLGAAADAEGQFIIVNIPPGVYSVRATMMGYATFIQENVQVSINQTTVLDYPMGVEAVVGQEVVVQAERPVVQMDISSSRHLVTAANIQDRPLENLEEILAAEAGISLSASAEGSGVIIRGSELNETDIVVDGLSTRNERNQQPAVTLNLTAIQEIEILTGGFSAEFGDLRSGMINVVTREGSRDQFNFNADIRYSPPARKHFGPNPFSTDGPFWQVYAGPDAFTGVTTEMVESDWDYPNTYPFTFIGWNEVARQFLADADPDNDRTPQELLEIWKWQHRLRRYADEPDIISDMTISGPVPMIPATFMLSHRYENLQLAYPYSRNNSLAETLLLKLTSYLTPKIKVSWNNSLIKQVGVSGSSYDDTNGMITGTRQGTVYARNALWWRIMWADASHSPIETTQYRGGISLNHILSDKTFYNLGIQYTAFRTLQEPIGLRDTTGIKQIGDSMYDEAPFVYVGSALGSIVEQYDILGDFQMSGGGRGQDHSKYAGITVSFDLVSQVNSTNEVKMGFTVDRTSFKERREINHSYTTRPQKLAPWAWWYFDATPFRVGAYIQDKLEFKGMIANIGIRMDYMDPGADPFDLEPTMIFEDLPYTLTNYFENDTTFDHLRTKEASSKLYFSPRLGISHPVTTTSKVFFNYTHLLQRPVMDRLYTVQPSSGEALVPNLLAEWPRTVSYELGFEQSLANALLIHVMGYYKDVSDQLSQQNIVSFDGDNNIVTWANNSYADIRGLEFKLEKRTGQWWYGYVTLEYMVRSVGYTGLRYVYENRQLARQQRENTNQERGWPVPSILANITFRTPDGWGPSILGVAPLGGWRLNVLHEWSDGGKELLNPEARLSEQNYVDVIDDMNTDLVLEKRFQRGRASVSAFVQVKNVFNYRGYVNPQYWTRYVSSLHFPHETGDQHGNDKLGEWDKDYIDLGWYNWSRHIHPRDIFFGIRIQF
ncbi:MAG: TonB-dependent receptor [Fidelibacterota bacterium]|nr:MAG: TonB-dependent receptor [Candidatus Neomarinimicrobiota bacterium]